MTPSSTDEVLSDEPWLSIRWDGDHKCVYAEWIGFANSVEFRASTMAILEAIRQKSSAALVSDNRRLEGVADADQLWLRDTWMPLAVAAGVKRIAVVLPGQGLGKVASEDIISRFGNTVFVTRTFTIVSEATKWPPKRDGKFERGTSRRLGEPTSRLNDLLLAGARLWSRPPVLGYENLLSVLLSRVAGYRHDLVALLGFCHDL